MEDSSPQSGRISSRQQRELTVQRDFEMERVEGTLMAAAYETVWPPVPARREQRGRLELHRCADATGAGSMHTLARARGRRGGTGSLVAMGG